MFIWIPDVALTQSQSDGTVEVLSGLINVSSLEKPTLKPASISSVEMWESGLIRCRRSRPEFNESRLWILEEAVIGWKRVSGFQGKMGVNNMFQILQTTRRSSIHLNTDSTDKNHKPHSLLLFHQRLNFPLITWLMSVYLWPCSVTSVFLIYSSVWNLC